LFFAIFASVICSCVSLNDPKTWIVNLDASPLDRWPWTEMLPIYNESIQQALALIDEFIPSEWEQDVVEEMALIALNYLGDYADEIRSGAKQLNIPLAQATLLNIIYEVEAGCTSIVAVNDNGEIFHGRNLDFSLASVLRSLVINVDFQSGGKTVYMGTTYAGYVGLLTGMRPNSFAISANQRDSGYLIENLLEALLVPGTNAACFLIRDTLGNFAEFSSAVKNLANEPLVAPIYLIASGVQPNQGVVITRDRNGAADVWALNSTMWFEVQTNWDHWEPDPDGRRDTANRGMQKLGQSRLNFPGLFSVLSTVPVLNKSTTYTTLMSAMSGTFNTTVRWQ